MNDRRDGNILIVDDEESMCSYLSVVLSRDGHKVSWATDAKKALELIDDNDFQVALVDLKMPGMNGLELLARLREKNRVIAVVVMTAYSSWESAVMAMRLGAFAYIRKPFDNDEIKMVVSNALSITDHLKTMNPDELISFGNLVGNTPQIREIQNILRQVAPTDTTVLIQGESGTGKELVARALHYGSHRRDKSFIAVNCAAFNENLLESELFGHAQGSFTGAISSKVGLFKVADGGTFFLDEVADMPKQTQIKLLRAIEDRKILPVGDVEVIPVDVRLIAATNRKLDDEVKAGRFREDLYYRLNVIPIQLPPLRHRRADIPLLAGQFLARSARITGKAVEGFTSEALEKLMGYHWPGNIRELDNVIQRAVTLCADSLTEEDNVILGASSEPQEPHGPARAALDAEGKNLGEKLASVEKELIQEALEKTDWSLSRTADLLQISYRQLRYRIDKLNIKSGRLVSEDNN